MTMQVLNKIYDEEIELFESETASAKDKYFKARDEIETLKQNAEQKTSQLKIISTNDSNNRAALIKDGVPQCPRCIVRSFNFHDMSPQSGDDEHDYFYCKTCGLQFEIKI